MSNIYELPSNERRYDEASLWIEKLSEGLTGKEIAELQAWIDTSPRNAEILFRMAKLWDKMDALTRLAALFPEPVAIKRTSAYKVVSLAASLVLALFVGVVGVFSITGPDEGISPPPGVGSIEDATFETAIGERRSETLADGTEVVLNTNSRVRVIYTNDYRLLILEFGELHVSVAKDSSRPLSVIAGDRILQAVGTRFNVEITGDQRIELVVTEGTVRVGLRQPSTDITNSPSILSSSSQVLVAGEELILGSPDEEIKTVTLADIEVKLSWRNGNLIFRGESLEDALAEVERYTAVEFVIQDANLRKLRIGGLFKAGDVDGLLAVLRENFDIAYERVDEDTVLLSAL